MCGCLSKGSQHQCQILAIKWCCIFFQNLGREHANAPTVLCFWQCSTGPHPCYAANHCPALSNFGVHGTWFPGYGYIVSTTLKILRMIADWIIFQKFLPRVKVSHNSVACSNAWPAIKFVLSVTTCNSLYIDWTWSKTFKCLPGWILQHLYCYVEFFVWIGRPGFITICSRWQTVDDISLKNSKHCGDSVNTRTCFYKSNCELFHERRIFFYEIYLPRVAWWPLITSFIKVYKCIHYPLRQEIFM